MRTILGAMRKEVPTGQRKMLNEVLHDFQSSPNVLKVRKPRSTKWAEHKVYREGGDEKNVQSIAGET
jgi:hypothetical protein